MGEGEIKWRWKDFNVIKTAHLYQSHILDSSVVCDHRLIWLSLDLKTGAYTFFDVINLFNLGLGREVT